MKDAALTPPPLPNPPRPEWVARFVRRILELDPGRSDADAIEEAGALYDCCWGEYTPEQAVDVATGRIDPAVELSHLFVGEESRLA